MPAPEEVVLPLLRPRDEIGVATEVRSTLLLGSIQSLRALGHYDRYVSHLDPAARETVLTSVAGVWLPMSYAIAHYEACDALALPLKDEVALGHAVGNRIQGAFLGLIVRTAKNAGVTPWAILTELNRIWDRTFRGGGGPFVAKLGPKEARVELIGLPILDVPYFRHAYEGTFLAAFEPFCNKVYVQETGPLLRRTPNEAAYRVSWA